MKRGMKRLSTRLMLILSIFIWGTGSVIGSTTYFIAKNELVKSGKLDLQHLVGTSMQTLTYLNEQVEAGELSLIEAKERAQELIQGPKTTDIPGQTHDYSQSPFSYKEDGYVFAITSDAKDAMVPYADEDSSEAGKQLNEALVKSAKEPDAKDRFHTYEWRAPGANGAHEEIAYMTYFEPWDWYVGIGVPLDEFYAGLNTLKWITILTTVVLVIIVPAVFYLIVKPKFKQLADLTDISGKIADGDLRIDKLKESADEFGQLNRSYNVMTTNLKSMHEHLQNLSSQLRETSTNLAAITEETQAGSEEVGTAMGEISKGVMTQVADIEEMSRNIEELSASIEEMNRHHQQMAQQTGATKAAIENGLKMVELLKSSNADSVKASDEISVGVTALYQKIQNISTITGTIKSITDQTNLLALNASIEAARAGEHGKGFSVVAQEVRKLAEESNHATLQIERMIEEIEADTEATVMAMSNTIGASAQLTEAVEKTELEFNDISLAVGKTGQALEGLSNEVSKVNTQSANMSTAVQGISAFSEETAASFEEISASVDEQLLAIQNETKLAQQLSDASESLMEVIHRYKV